jgi:mannose-1-phosphate guanylyltransferase
LLAETRLRAERSIPAEQILFALTQSHREFYLDELSDRPSHRVVQPQNKGTAPPILFSLLSIERADRDAIVAILPCDHHYSDEDLFTDALESAFDAATACPRNVILLGASADCPEVEYGWIELGPPVHEPESELFHVRRFQEKPSIEIAQELLAAGAVWNTFVMVGHVRAFLDMLEATVPDLVVPFCQVPVWAGAEAHLDRSLYQQIHPVDFSRQVLSVAASRLRVLNAGQIGWNDLGDPARVLAVIEQTGCEPRWLQDWRQSRRKPAMAVPPPHWAVA